MLALQSLTTLVLARINDERGATAVEYGLMVALIAAVIIAVVTALGGNLDAIFGEVCTDIGTAVTTSGGAATACP